jgi:hypothetical protein
MMDALLFALVTGAPAMDRVRAPIGGAQPEPLNRSGSESDPKRVTKKLATRYLAGAMGQAGLGGDRDGSRARRRRMKAKARKSALDDFIRESYRWSE